MLKKRLTSQTIAWVIPSGSLETSKLKKVSRVNLDVRVTQATSQTNLEDFLKVNVLCITKSVKLLLKKHCTLLIGTLL